MIADAYEALDWSDTYLGENFLASIDESTCFQET